MTPFSPEITERKTKKSSGASRWRVVLYNDHRHRLDDVCTWLQDYTECESEFAIEICHVCHDQGRAVCFQGSKEECRQVTAELRAHGLQVEVDDY